MTLQTIELDGERYVILPEKEFLELQQKAGGSGATDSPAKTCAGFREVTPLKVGGIPASQLLIQDRR